MRSLRSLSTAVLTAGALVALAAQSALAQVEIDPTESPAENNSPTGPLGPLPSIATIMFALGVVILILLIVSYMRYAPRFSSDEEHFKVVRADRVRVGQELPRRAVDISQAVAVVVGPPPVPTTAVAASAPAVAAPAPVVAAAPAAAAPAPAAPAPAAPASAADAAPAATPAAPADAPAAEERPEVSLDEEVFQQTLDELLAKGTSRRVAEGQARRAAMIAARKKAAGG